MDVVTKCVGKQGGVKVEKPFADKFVGEGVMVPFT
jgi:hypothetical protein